MEGVQRAYFELPARSRLNLERRRVGFEGLGGFGRRLDGDVVDPDIKAFVGLCRGEDHEVALGDFIERHLAGVTDCSLYHQRALVKQRKKGALNVDGKSATILPLVRL